MALSHASAAREGGGEALTGVRVGPAIEPRNQGSGVLTPSPEAEGNTVGRVIASGLRTSRGLGTGTCVESSCSRTERSHGRPCLSMMPRPVWFAGWQIGGWRAVRGTLRR